jgi:hypothetical protein
MRGVIQTNLQRAGYAVAPLTAMPYQRPPSPTPLMVSTHPPAATPSPTHRNCVRVLNLDAGRVLVLSFDNAGLVVERYEGPSWMVTDRKLEAMHANLSATPPDTPPTLALVTD